MAPYQQIYRRLIRKAVADASAVARRRSRRRAANAASMMARPHGRAGRSRPRAGPAGAEQVDAIVEGTDEVLDFLAADMGEDRPRRAATDSREIRAAFNCVGGRGQVDDAAASIVAFALRQSGLEAASTRRGETPSGEGKGDRWRST